MCNKQPQQQRVTTLSSLLTLLLAGSASLCPVYASAGQSLESLMSRAPAGFSEFFTRHNGPITVDFYQQQVSVDSEFTTITATVSAKDRETLEQFFTGQGVKAATATAMTDALISGIESSSECRGLVARCTLDPEHYDFVFDPDNRRLRVFVNDEHLDMSLRQRYIKDNETGSISAINTSSFYSQNSRQSSSSHWQNETTVALPVGYFQSDTALTADDGNTALDVYEANYTLDFFGFSAEMGYDTTLNMENSAFSLSRGQVAGGYHATLFSNQRLAVRNQNRFDEMTLFAQETTELEIMRGDRLIYRGMLKQGVNRISYSTFERGSYNVELIYKVGGIVVKTETRNIFNIPLFDMTKGEYEWFARAGKYQNDLYGDYAYAKGAVAGRWFDSAIVGAGYENVGGLSLISAYLEAIPMESVRAGLVVNTGLNNNVYYNAQLGLGPMAVTGEWLDASDDEFRSIYQSNDYRQLNLAIPFAALGGSYTLNAQHYETLADPDRNEQGNETRSLFVTGSYRYGTISLSGTVQYNFAQQDEDDGWMMALNASVPLDNFSLSSGFQHDQLGSLVQNTLGYNTSLSDQTRLAGEVSLLSRDTDQQFSATAAVDHRNDYASGSAQVYADSSGQVNTTINLSSTQLIDSETLLFTSERSPSYMVLENDSVMGIDEGSSIGNMEIRNQSQGGTRVVTVDQPTQVLPVSEYSKYAMNLQTGNSRYTSLGGAAQDYFAKPGTFVKVKNNLVKINRYLVSFSNEAGDFASDITCSGTGCNGVEEIADDVYQISLFEGYRFVLRSGSDICLLPNMMASGEVMNLGRSICTSENTLERLAESMPEDHRLYYLGATEQVNPDLSMNTTHVKVGDLYGQFLFSREEKVLESAGVIYKVPVEYYTQRADLLGSASVTPREIPFPITDIDNTVAQE